LVDIKVEDGTFFGVKYEIRGSYSLYQTLATGLNSSRIINVRPGKWIVGLRPLSY
jgi:hypothetical protein